MVSLCQGFGDLLDVLTDVSSSACDNDALKPARSDCKLDGYNDAEITLRGCEEVDILQTTWSMDGMAVGGETVKELYASFGADPLNNFSSASDDGPLSRTQGSYRRIIHNMHILGVANAQ